MNFVVPLLLFCLFPFYTLFLGWLPVLSFATSASFHFTPLPDYFASQHAKLFFHHETHKAAVIDIEFHSAQEASFVVINMAGHSARSFYTVYGVLDTLPLYY